MVSSGNKRCPPPYGRGEDNAAISLGASARVRMRLPSSASFAFHAATIPPPRSRRNVARVERSETRGCAGDEEMIFPDFAPLNPGYMLRHLPSLARYHATR